MTKGWTSPRQVVFGMALGILLFPVPLILEFAYFRGTEGTLNVPFHAALYFGVVQAFTILPASLRFYLVGKHDVVRGLLYFGTFAALCNVLLWIFVYRGFFNPHIY
jgi:hypothetical protein